MSDILVGVFFGLAVAGLFLLVDISATQKKIVKMLNAIVKDLTGRG